MQLSATKSAQGKDPAFSGRPAYTASPPAIPSSPLPMRYLACAACAPHMLAVTTLDWARMRKTRRVAKPMPTAKGCMAFWATSVVCDAHPAPARGPSIAASRSIFPPTARLRSTYPHGRCTLCWWLVLVCWVSGAAPSSVTIVRQVVQPSHQVNRCLLKILVACDRHARTCSTGTVMHRCLQCLAVVVIASRDILVDFGR